MKGACIRRRWRLVTSAAARWDEVSLAALQALSLCSGRKGGCQRLREGITAGKKGVREGGETAVIGCNNPK